MPITRFLLAFLLIASGYFVRADDFCKNSIISQLIGDVVDTPMGGTGHTPQILETFMPGDILKTGFASRVELTAQDSSVIRIGANSVFSFSNESREMILNQGSVLFHTPHGEGGGIIKTAAITAAVTGSTVAVCTTSSGGAKVVPLESPCTITGADGRAIATIKPGQLLALIPGNKPVVVSIDLAAFVHSSGLIKSFKQPLNSEIQSKIEQNATKQSSNIQVETNTFLVDDHTVKTTNPIPDVYNILEKQVDLIDYVDSQSQVLFGRDFVRNLKTNLDVTNDFLTDLSGHVHLLYGASFFRSPLAYIEYTGVSEPSSYFSRQLLSAATLATLGVTGAYPSGFVLPGASRALIGLNVDYLGSTSDSTTDLTEVENDHFFAVVALRNLLIRDTGVATEYFNYTNTPTYLSFGARGTLTVDGSALSTDTPLTFTVPTSTVSFGSVGRLYMNNVLIEGGENIYIGSRTETTLENVTLEHTSTDLNAMNITSLGTVNLTDVNMTISSGSAAARSVTVNGYTLNLRSVNFGSPTLLTLYSETGSPNFNGHSILGDINFLNNDNRVDGTVITAQNVGTLAQLRAR